MVHAVHTEFAACKRARLRIAVRVAIPGVFIADGF
jgi:hypothetical protein